jgi:hypothetical protein
MDSDAEIPDRADCRARKTLAPEFLNVLPMMKVQSPGLSHLWVGFDAAIIYEPAPPITIWSFLKTLNP